MEGEITRLLSAWSGGESTALDELIPLVYAELHRMAERYMSSQHPGHTLQPTALINEMYVKLAGGRGRTWQDRAHFFGVASIAMRQVLVNYAEAHLASKRGGGQAPLRLDDAEAQAAQSEAAEVVAVDEALSALAEVDPRKAKVVELRYFAGLTVEEIAEVLGISPVTVMRDWQMARNWLARELGRPVG
jgi:RNA polymerase sigma factor (TIGR02999 family)